jgi:hypothetical protein
MVEIELLEHLNKARENCVVCLLLGLSSPQADAEDKHHVARMYDYFICKGHVCIVFELLSVNLYELLKSNAYRCVVVSLVLLLITFLPGVSPRRWCACSSRSCWTR